MFFHYIFEFFVSGSRFPKSRARPNFPRRARGPNSSGFSGFGVGRARSGNRVGARLRTLMSTKSLAYFTSSYILGLYTFLDVIKRWTDELRFTLINPRKNNKSKLTPHPLPRNFFKQQFIAIHVIAVGTIQTYKLSLYTIFTNPNKINMGNKQKIKQLNCSICTKKKKN